MPRFCSQRRPALRHLLCLLTFVGTLFLTGCATAPATYRTLARTPERVPKLHTVVVAPLDAELSELSAGGLLERRDDWTDQATANLTSAIAAETGWQPSTELPADQLAKLRAETDDVQSLLRAISLNHFMTAIPGRAPAPFPVKSTELTYQTGPLKDYVAAVGSEAVLFVFVRNSYATAGRKSLLALSFIGAAFTGVAIIPAMGSDVMSAALVESDGTVLWCNFNLGGEDPRTPAGARDVAKKLLAGLPKRAT